MGSQAHDRPIHSASDVGLALEGHHGCKLNLAARTTHCAAAVYLHCFLSPWHFGPIHDDHFKEVSVPICAAGVSISHGSMHT